jgi:hypothetical protein
VGQGVHQGLQQQGVVWHQSNLVLCLLCSMWPHGLETQRCRHLCECGVTFATGAGLCAMTRLCAVYLYVVWCVHTLCSNVREPASSSWWCKSPLLCAHARFQYAYSYSRAPLASGRYLHRVFEAGCSLAHLCCCL